MMTRKRLQYVAGIAGGLAVWVLATEPWGIAVYQLVVFMAPGALLGLGAGWMAYASDQHAWSWRAARTAALIGAIALPPVLAFLVALDGNARPHRLLAGFIRAAWVAFAVGLAVAAARSIRDRSEKR
ncbi:MAG: hypothetical protein WD801_00875 [Gemmatimonadaceae bacterium]